jgi:hypothetical protein
VNILRGVRPAVFSMAWKWGLLRRNIFIRPKPGVSIRLKERTNTSMKWLNETFPTRVLLAFTGGLAVVVMWKALEHLIG